MASSHNSQKKLIEVLWQKINTAILGSPEVQTAMTDLKNASQLDAVKEFNLMLGVEKLIEETLEQNPETKPEPKSGALGELLVRDEETKPTPKKLNQFVDGKALSPNEISFLEYLVDQFDQNLWMKKAGIRF